jgi:hypothetical protein
MNSNSPYYKVQMNGNFYDNLGNQLAQGAGKLPESTEDKDKKSTPDTYPLVS